MEVITSIIGDQCINGQRRNIMNRQRGRPRQFDLEQALDSAIGVFRQQGYHAASISDLGAAMGLTAGSLYKAFKDKRQLFLAAFERYTLLRRAALNSHLQDASSGFEAVRRVLQFYVRSSGGDEGQQGCLVVGSMVALSTLDTDLADHVRRSAAGLRGQLQQQILRGQQDGSITPDVNAEVSAELLYCLLQGMRVAGKCQALDEAVIPTALKLLT